MKTNLNTLIYTFALAFGGFVMTSLSSNASAMALSIPHNTSATVGTSNALPIIKIAGHRNRNRANRVRNRNRAANRNRGRFRNHRANRNRFTYRSNRHGRRFRSQRGRNRYYRNGFWYAAPFWLGQTIYNNRYYDNGYYGDDYYEPQDSGHVQWCRNRYKTYNSRTDTFRGYDGYDHKCRSPY